MDNTQYEQGWQDGYQAFQRGFGYEYRTVSLKDQTIVGVVSKQPVTRDMVEFAQGHMDGWTKAAEESW